MAGYGLPSKAFMFWYICNENGPTEYIYIIAFTEKQARYFFIKNGYTKMYDYSLNPVRVIKPKRYYQLGDMLGQDTIV